MATRRRAPGRARTPRTRGADAAGRRLEVIVGPPAHGGHAVARAEDRVVFVRHALPGERVVVEVTEGGERDRFWRADAVEVLEPSADRVVPPCPLAGPGRCGGCDLQHASLPAQRNWKTAVVREQFVRLAGWAADDPRLTALHVEPAAGEPREDDGLRWRSRIRFVALPDGRRGLRKHRSHEVIPVDDCLIATSEAQQADPRAGETATEAVTAAGETHTFTRAADGFWQPHVDAPRTLVEAVLELLDPRPGESVLDLYAGVGLFARFLADRIGPGARLALVEGDRLASSYSRGNLGDHRRLTVRCGDVADVLRIDLDEPFDLVVLDPPRAGAKAAVVRAIVDRAPRAVAYVACDPAALARDVRTFAEHGYDVTALRAFDLFPMTHHVECVALLTRGGPRLEP